MTLRYWEKKQKKEVVLKVNILRVIDWFKKRKKKRRK